MIDKPDLWITIVGLGLGSFALRFVFLGLVGDRALPDWLLRHLRYTAVAILPAFIAPLVLWPQATGGTTDPLRLLSALAALAVGLATKSVFGSIGAGAAVLIAGAYWP